MRSATIAFAAAMIAGTAAQDPASSWLAYVGFNTTGACTAEGRRGRAARRADLAASHSPAMVYGLPATPLLQVRASRASA